MLSNEWILNNKISGIKLVFPLYATTYVYHRLKWHWLPLKKMHSYSAGVASSRDYGTRRFVTASSEVHRHKPVLSRFNRGLQNRLITTNLNVSLPPTSASPNWVPPPRFSTALYIILVFISFRPTHRFLIQWLCRRIRQTAKNGYEFSSCQSDLPHSTTRLSIDGFSWNFIQGDFFEKSDQKIQLPLKFHKNNGYFMFMGPCIIFIVE